MRLLHLRCDTSLTTAQTLNAFLDSHGGAGEGDLVDLLALSTSPILSKDRCPDMDSAGQLPLLVICHTVAKITSVSLAKASSCLSRPNSNIKAAQFDFSGETLIELVS